MEGVLVRVPFHAVPAMVGLEKKGENVRVIIVFHSFLFRSKYSQTGRGKKGWKGYLLYGFQLFFHAFSFRSSGDQAGIGGGGPRNG